MVVYVPGSVVLFLVGLGVSESLNLVVLMVRLMV